ncbi:LD-carboxypeptidase [Geomicrobium sp. JSM 1781026]|uniref:S66 peptidase family protein n=1 Tax=Geomicrobium sp. JSM 1781026 TaxID=3344580 RepID=UPI0035C221B3
MKKKRKAKGIGTNSTLGLAMPSGPAKRHQFEEATRTLEGYGFKTVTSRPFKEYPGYLAGSIGERVEELHTLFVDPDVDAILCLRGGYGSASLLPFLDYDLIAKHQKLFLGYSDITALHIAFTQRANMVTMHSPMATSDLLDADRFTTDRLLQAMKADGFPSTLFNPSNYPLKTLSHGTVEGELVGGNLSVIASLMGTPFELDTKGKILFLEDVDEEPYAIDRMLTQLSLAGKLDEAVGFVLGTCKDCDSKDYPNGDTVIDVCDRILSFYQKPILYNLQAGHGSPQITLPLGVRARLNATNKTLHIIESAVV